MESLQRFTRALHYNFVLYAVVIVVLIYVLATPSLTEPILEFIFAGVLPGRNQVIAPNTMILGVGIVLALLLCIVLLFGLRRWLAVRRAMISFQTDLEITQNVGKVTQDLIYDRLEPTAVEHWPAGQLSRKLVSQTTTPARGPVLVYVVMRHLRTRLSVVITAISSKFIRVSRTFAERSAVVQVAVVSSLRFGTMRLVGVTLTITQLTLKYSRLYGRRFWTFIRPHMRRLDSWLELKYRVLSTWTIKKLARIEPLDVVLRMWRESKASLRQFFK